MKKIYSLMLVLMASTTMQAFDALIDGFYFNLSDDEAEVTSRRPSSRDYSGDVVIPESVFHDGKTYIVTSIGERAFESCTNMTSISIPETVNTIGDGAFGKCSGLTSITIPQSVTSIGKSAFKGCTGLTSITIPDGVTTIKEYTFDFCDGLTSVALGCGVTSIERSSFGSCYNLTSLTCNAVEPPSCATHVFGTIDHKKCVLYVPQGSEEAYGEAEEWKDFIHIEIATAISNLASDKYSCNIYDLQGRRLQQPKRGINIIDGKKTVRK